MIKALFFDIDGTLVSLKTHEIPQSTIDSIKQAKEKGIKIFISTGRPVQFITNLKAIEQYIDGYISTNGANCFVGDNTISLKPIEKDDVHTMIRLSFELDFACIIIGEKSAMITNRNEKVSRIFIEGLKVPECFDHSFDEVLSQNILQFTPFITEEQEKDVLPQLKKCFAARWNPEFTDITAQGVDKGSALVKFAEALGINIEETMAFGDGGNDISIIQKSGIGVVMGNATDAVKQYADYITTSVDDDGIKNALIHFGII